MNLEYIALVPLILLVTHGKTQSDGQTLRVQKISNYCEKVVLLNEPYAISNYAHYTCKNGVCPHDEEFIECASHCQPTCDNPILDPNMICRLDCAICVCRAGYIRETAGGRCIPRDKCPRCPLNEKRVECASTCQPSCQHPNHDPDAFCVAGCATCICDDGFIRDDSTGRCVHFNNCPRADSK